MKIFSISIAIITGLFLLSTLICGLWIRANNVADESSIGFHMNIGIASVILSFVAVVLLLVLSFKR